MPLKIIKLCANAKCGKYLGEVESTKDNYHQVLSSICFCENCGISHEISYMFPRLPYLYDRELKEKQDRERVFYHGDKHHIDFIRRDLKISRPQKKKYPQGVSNSQSSLDDFMNINQKR